MGKNKFEGAPRLIAKFLNLPDVEKYTGHSFRRSSATMLVNAGADLLTLKAHGGWKSDSSAQRYIHNSVNRKRRIGNMIASEIECQSLTSSSTNRSSTVTGDLVVSEIEYDSSAISSTNPKASSTVTSDSVDTSYTCSQSIVQFSTSSVDVQNHPPNFDVSTGIPSGPSSTITVPSALNGLEGMNFSNCHVNIYFNKQ